MKNIWRRCVIFKVEPKKDSLKQGTEIAILKLTGSLDAEHIASFESQLYGLIHYKIKYIILDLSGITFINNAGYGLLLKVVKEFKNKDGAIFLASTPEKILGLFKMFGMLKDLQHFATVEEGKEFAFEDIPFYMLEMDDAGQITAIRLKIEKDLIKKPTAKEIKELG